MHCPYCHFEDTRVIDSRLTEDGMSVRRRRECPQCSERFNTFETPELKLPQILKHDGRREAFDERKLRVGLERALQKRPVEADAIDVIVEHLVKKLRTAGEREIPSRKLGEWVMAELKAIDQVAYVRFASVYRRFEDVQEFREEVERLERDIPRLEGRQMSLLEEEQAAAAPAPKAKR